MLKSVAPNPAPVRNTPMASVGHTRARAIARQPRPSTPSANVAIGRRGAREKAVSAHSTPVSPPAKLMLIRVPATGSDTPNRWVTGRSSGPYAASIAPASARAPSAVAKATRVKRVSCSVNAWRWAQRRVRPPPNPGSARKGRFPRE